MDQLERAGSNRFNNVWDVKEGEGDTRNDLAVKQPASREMEETELANKLVSRRGSTVLKVSIKRCRNSYFFFSVESAPWQKHLKSHRYAENT